ncbi:hypothetical protein ACFC14_18535 [Microbacterium sp. NPDC055988]|uniref:hypothetical protein n=1 Tax=Microbacterium sp. NPDC055988 TaxID=3345671 RepID=UPI0035E0A0A4
MSYEAKAYSGDALSYTYPQVIELGLVPEPITTDPKEYIAAAVAAWGTFDSTGETTMPQWGKYLESWQNLYPTTVELPTGETVTFDPPEKNPVFRTSWVDHRDLWVIGERPSGTDPAWDANDWDLLQARGGRVVAEATEIGKLEPVMFDNRTALGERQSVVEFTQWMTLDDGTDGEHEISFTKHGSALVTINCSTTTPAPDSAQQAGDCKLVSFKMLDFK